MTLPMPLNGTKTHPLTKHALGELERIAAAPVPRQEVNPGVVDRLLREDLVEAYFAPSPYQTRKGLVPAHNRGRQGEDREMTSTGKAAASEPAIDTVDDDDFVDGDCTDDDFKCPTCKGRFTVNPLTAPQGFFCVGTTDCPTCDGSGELSHEPHG
jgi:hypothetical protein